MTMDFFITIGTQLYTITRCISNINNFPEELQVHNHEEADTLIILHALYVSQRDPFQELTICSPDTDVFLLLIYYQRSLCNLTVFRTGKF